MGKLPPEFRLPLVMSVGSHGVFTAEYRAYVFPPEVEIGGTAVHIPAAEVVKHIGVEFFVGRLLRGRLVFFNDSRLHVVSALGTADEVAFHTELLVSLLGSGAADAQFFGNPADGGHFFSHRKTAAAYSLPDAVIELPVHGNVCIRVQKYRLIDHRKISSPKRVNCHVKNSINCIFSNAQL